MTKASTVRIDSTIYSFHSRGSIQAHKIFLADEELFGTEHINYSDLPSYKSLFAVFPVGSFYCVAA